MTKLEKKKSWSFPCQEKKNLFHAAFGKLKIIFDKNMSEKHRKRKRNFTSLSN